MREKHNVYNLYRIFYYVMYYIVPEICIGGRFQRTVFIAVPGKLYLLLLMNP